MAIRQTVLVVEDDVFIRMAGVDLVEITGFHALEAFNADEAIIMLEASPDIQLVFTDVDMPGSMDGKKLAHYVRRRWPHIWLIVASGKPSIPETELPLGAKFFSKPYHHESIAAAMIAMLASVPSAR